MNNIKNIINELSVWHGIAIGILLVLAIAILFYTPPRQGGEEVARTLKLRHRITVVGEWIEDIKEGLPYPLGSSAYALERTMVRRIAERQNLILAYIDELADHSDELAEYVGAVDRRNKIIKGIEDNL